MTSPLDCRATSWLAKISHTTGLLLQLRCIAKTDLWISLNKHFFRRNRPAPS
jgi:hypothetical protein